MIAVVLLASTSHWLQLFRTHVSTLSPLARFAVALAVIFAIPPISRRLRLPSVVGLLVAGIVLGPYVLDLFGKERGIYSHPEESGEEWERRCSFELINPGQSARMDRFGDLVMTVA